MKRYLAAALVLALLLAGTSVVQAQPEFEFKLGFKALADQIPDVVGQPLEEEHWGDNGDSLQRTSNGLMAWRKADNWTAFTNGSTTWVSGPDGVQSRANNQRFPFETIPNYLPTAEPIYSAIFEEGLNDWEVGNLPFLPAEFVDGELVYTFLEPNRSASNIPFEEAPDSYDLRAEVRFPGPGESTAGLLFSFSKDPRSSYVFYLESDGWYVMGKRLPDQDWELLQTEEAPIFVRNGGINYLRVVKVGPNIALYLNGERVGMLRDATLAGRGVGISVSSRDDPNVQIAWRSFNVYPVESGEAPVITTSADEPGWRRLENPIWAMAVSVPENWISVSPGSEELKAVLGATRARAPEAADALASLAAQLSESQIAAMHISPEPVGTGLLAYLTLDRDSDLVLVSLDPFVRACLSDVQATPGLSSAVAQRRLFTPFGEIAELKYSVKITPPGKPESSEVITEYLGMSGRYYFVLRAVTKSDWADGYSPVFEKIGRSVVFQQ